MTNSLHFSEWRNCIRAQRKVNLCAPGAPKGPKVGMFVRQYEIVCANDAGRAPRKYPELYVFFFSFYYYYYYFVIVCILSASEWILSRYTALYK